jgi:molecular chaperone GrpE (heat shock protein)
MTDAPFTETHRTTPRYHCVTQLQKNSWEYREKGNDAPNEDDLVSAEAFDAALAEIDRLTKENAELREELDAVQADIDEGRQR